MVSINKYIPASLLLLPALLLGVNYIVDRMHLTKFIKVELIGVDKIASVPSKHYHLISHRSGNMDLPLWHSLPLWVVSVCMCELYNIFLKKLLTLFGNFLQEWWSRLKAYMSPLNFLSWETGKRDDIQSSSIPPSLLSSITTHL